MSAARRLDNAAAKPPGEAVLARLAAFRHTLRDAGMVAGLGESEDAARLILFGLGAEPETLRAAFKALFCSRKSDWDAFDGLFDAFWLGRGVRSRTRIVGLPAPANAAALPSLAAPRHQDTTAAELGEARSRRDQTGNDPENADGRGRMEGASRLATLVRTDFRKLADPASLAEAHAIAEQLARGMRARITRRSRAVLHGRRIALRRTIHRNIVHGGELIELVHRARKPKPLRLVLLLDASGSMNLYTSVFIRFMHGVLDHFRDADAFLFHTRLIEISDAMREKGGSDGLPFQGR
jgi:uncharacterized protein with von Willebrand factor type A (vWA) domain